MPCSFTRIPDWPALMIAWLSRILIPALAGRIRTTRPEHPGTFSRGAPQDRPEFALPARSAVTAGHAFETGRARSATAVRACRSGRDTPAYRPPNP